MTLYLDTEFNGHGGQLISLALASTDGSSWYGVLPLPAQPHPFVKEHVLPFLNAEPMGVAEFRASLHAYLTRYSGETIVADWPADFGYLCQIMCGPDFDRAWSVELAMYLLTESDPKPLMPHNALSDAWALLHWHQEKMAG